MDLVEWVGAVAGQFLLAGCRSVSNKKNKRNTEQNIGNARTVWLVAVMGKFGQNWSTQPELLIK
jgi:hypothetical protein